MTQRNEGIIVSGGSFNANQVTVGRNSQAHQVNYAEDVKAWRQEAVATTIADDLLAQATCLIAVDGGASGTAWLVSREGYLITAGHILGTDEPKNTVEVKFLADVPRKAHLITWGYQQAMGIDFAILKLESLPSNREPLPISLPRSVSGGCRLFGYGKTLETLSTGMGQFVGSSYPQNSKANQLFRLRSSELSEEGYSGGAVFSEKLEAVVAIQTETTRARIGAGHDTVLAMPLYRIAYYWEPLVNLVEKN